MRLLVEVGSACSRYQDLAFRNLKCRRVQVDELWAFVYAKQKNVTPEIVAKNPNAGDIWLWVAIEAETKLVPCWMLGPRDSGAATEFVRDVASRLSRRVQITSDGHKVYLDAVEDSFRANVDFAMLVKIYGRNRESETRYSPATCIGTRVQPIIGDPDLSHISTSYVER